MSKININVTHVEQVVPHSGGDDGSDAGVITPDTGAFTHTAGTSSLDSNTFYIGAGIILAIVFVIVIPFVLLKKKVFKKTSGFSLFSKRKSLFRLFAIMLVSLGMTSLFIYAMDRNTSKTQAAHPAENLTVTAGDIDIDVEVDDEPAVVYVPHTITITESTDAGYRVSAYAGTRNLAQEDGDAVIYGWGQGEANAWCISVVDPYGEGGAIPYGLGASAGEAMEVKSFSSATQANDKVTVWYGVTVDPSVADGTYSGDIYYTAVSNAVPMMISDLTYMQDFKTLTATERAEVLSSMTEGAEYQLTDSRDNKVYYIAKLADGNVYMTQNLDFDISNSTTYTPSDTDVPSNWTPNRTTYASDNYTWNGTSSVPESYDPGDLYWSGTLNDGATISGNAHYHIGNYYNWTAALGQNDASGVRAAGALIDQSICPAGWTLPRGGYGEDSYYALVSEYDTFVSDTQPLVNDTSLWESPMYVSLSGVYNASLLGVGEYGSSWTAVLCDVDNACGFDVGSNGNVNPGVSGDPRVFGLTVRCMARPVTDTATLVAP